MINCNRSSCCMAGLYVRLGAFTPLSQRCRLTTNMIPKNTERALDLYVNEGIRPGGFLEALLCNDLISACIRSDKENANALREIVLWCYGNLPGDSWGDKASVESWLRDFVPETVR